MRANLFKLADVALLLFVSREERPDLRDLFATHVKQPRSFRSIEPFMKRGSEVVAIQIRLFEIKLRERMGAVDDGFNATTARHFADCFYRSDLPGEVYLMCNLQQTCARRDRAFKSGGYFVDVLWRNRNSNQVQLNAFALFTLANRCEHARIVLRRSQHFIAGLEIETEQQCFQSL